MIVDDTARCSDLRQLVFRLQGRSRSRNGHYTVEQPGGILKIGFDSSPFDSIPFDITFLFSTATKAARL
jgi:hypothetical protein